MTRILANLTLIALFSAIYHYRNDIEIMLMRAKRMWLLLKLLFAKDKNNNQQ